MKWDGSLGVLRVVPSGATWIWVSPVVPVMRTPMEPSGLW